MDPPKAEEWSATLPLVVASYELVCEYVSPAGCKGYNFQRANRRAHVLTIGAFANSK
jgi:hypothetical protein